MTTSVAPLVGPQAEKSVLTIQKSKVKKHLLSAEFTEPRTLASNPCRFAKRLTE